MKKVIVFTIVLICIYCCSSVRKFQSDYLLVKKYPLELPDMNISIINDTCAVLLQKWSDKDTLFFEFYRNKHWLVVTKISDTVNIVSLNKGDTLVYFKKDIVLFNDKNKLVFQRK